MSKKIKIDTRPYRASSLCQVIDRDGRVIVQFGSREKARMTAMLLNRAYFEGENDAAQLAIDHLTAEPAGQTIKHNPDRR